MKLRSASSSSSSSFKKQWNTRKSKTHQQTSTNIKQLLSKYIDTNVRKPPIDAIESSSKLNLSTSKTGNEQCSNSNSISHVTDQQAQQQTKKEILNTIKLNLDITIHSTQCFSLQINSEADMKYNLCYSNGQTTYSKSSTAKKLTITRNNPLY
ncbi:unnamed protein product [Rotaria sordida]|uniref:Uncharacterized protein n=1 Tax=Rotaria sordida TaxID=392033 RepID=A0A815UIT1_9BILA|nr:unnamed protein product [Rotaria sordida]CAF4205212.1 unnamed protein product [Rotaria sordida]